MKKEPPSLLTRSFRWMVTALFVSALFFFADFPSTTQVCEGEPPVLYSNRAGDNLRKTLVEAINQASQSVFLKIYSLNDPKIIQALNGRAKQIDVTVVHDVTTSQKGYRALSPSVEKIAKKVSGLMHQKILVCDEQKVWLGSANLTRESLSLHENLIVGLDSKSLAAAVKQEQAYHLFYAGGQKVEFFSLPKKGKEALAKLISLIDGAQESIRVAMFTWTHPDLTEAIARAHRRGVEVEVILDQTQGNGVSRQAKEELLKAEISLHMGGGLGLVHHKCAWIDGKILINGSANWTRSAFTRNADCFLILYDLNEQQQEKLQKLWERTWKITHPQSPPTIACKSGPLYTPKLVGIISYQNRCNFFSMAEAKWGPALLSSPRHEATPLSLQSRGVRAPSTFLMPLS